MMKDDQRSCQGSLDCGPIFQAAHLDPVRQARNADLHAICAIAEEVTGCLAALCRPKAVYNTFAAMVADLVPRSVEDGCAFESFIDGAGI
jgi:hypothetical protein